jgi:predicted nuclease of predicted toxin-antitoxin system
VKFLIDMPLSPKLAYWLNQQGHNAIHASDIGLHCASDTLIIELRKEQRIVITADLDYPRLLALTHAEGPSLILFRGGNFSDQESINYLSKLLWTMSEEDLSNSIVVIDKNRIRRRRLPLK